MNVFELAKKVELEGEKIYKEGLERTSNPGLKRILKMLLDAEINHYRIFDAMEHEKKPESVSHFSFDSIKHIFENIRSSPEGLDFNEEEIEVYKKALKFETNTERFYREQAEKTADKKLKEEFILVAEEEKKHKHIVQNLLDFVNRPNEWLENAEFNHLDQY